MNEKKLADVLILARGGGSIEDLWPFNEEVTARAIYNSKIPIISAVGHETDFTISDFVADLRAPTPSAAAEIAIADIEEVNAKLDMYNSRYKMLLKKKLENVRLQYEKLMKSRVFTDPKNKINEYYMLIDIKIKELEKHMTSKIESSKLHSQKLISKLDAISPLKTLTRGYCITEHEGKTIKSSKELKKGDEIKLQFADGIVGATVSCSSIEE